MWLQLHQVLKKFSDGNARKFTVNFAFCAHVDVMKIEKALMFSFEGTDFLSFRYQCTCNGKL